MKFCNYKKIFKELEQYFYIFKNNINKKINFMNEIIYFYNEKKNNSDINYQMKANIQNNHFDYTQNYQKIINNLNNQIEEMKKLQNLLKTNENNNNIIKEIEKFENFKFEKINNFKTLNNNKGTIWCLKTLYDGRLAAGDEYSNLIIYDKQIFNPDIIIQNNLKDLYNFTQLKNKNIACSFKSFYTLKIIKIKNKNEYENIQIIKNAHNKWINKIIELKNENIVSFSWDYSFKIWKINNNNFEIKNEFKDIKELSDGLEIKDNEIILYALKTSPQSLVFYDLNKNEKIKTLNNLNLNINCLCRIIKLNENEAVVAGEGKVYLIDIKNYLILHEINSDCNNYCILKLSNNLFLIGDEKGNINQFNIENKKIIKEFYNISHGSCIYSMTILNDMLISGDFNGNIKVWKK